MYLCIAIPSPQVKHMFAGILHDNDDSKGTLPHAAYEVSFSFWSPSLEPPEGLVQRDLADVEFSRAMTPSAQFAPFACRASDPIGEWHPVSRACRRDANLWRIEIMDDAWQRE